MEERNKYLEKLRCVGRWEKLLSVKTSPSKLRVPEIIFRGYCNPMFTFVFWVLLEIFLPHATTHDGCWLAGKTRGRKESCYGDLRQLNDAMARAAGTPPRTKVCLKHWRSIEKNDNRCSSTLSETHSPKLTALPRGLYHYIDKQGGKTKKYRPARNGALNVEHLVTSNLDYLSLKDAR